MSNDIQRIQNFVFFFLKKYSQFLDKQKKKKEKLMECKG